MEIIDYSTLETESQANLRRRNTDIICEVERLHLRFPTVNMNRVFECVGKKFYITGRRVCQIWNERQKQLDDSNNCLTL